MLSRKKLAVLGAGTLGEAVIAGLLDAKALPKSAIVATARHPERIEAVGRKHGVRTMLDNVEAVRGADIVLLAVKPKALPELLHGIRGALRPRQTLISVVASAGTAAIERLIGKRVPVVRAMPNTPCLVREGMTGLCAGRHARAADLALAEEIFGAVGRTLVVDEVHMDAVTGLSASGPAFIYVVIESLAEAGVKVGLPRKMATDLVAQMVLGSAKMVLETQAHPALLKDMVTTPAGCTIDGLMELEDGGLRVTLIKAVVQATQRSKELFNG
ncbi:MAG: pyrroline-5-carboxylate reductase [Planctomycetes bacterium]|nr:pyrroline-5-carboxylate reductase [Planctomycetota bacterium]